MLIGLSLGYDHDDDYDDYGDDDSDDDDDDDDHGDDDEISRSSLSINHPIFVFVIVFVLSWVKRTKQLQATLPNEVSLAHIVLFFSRVLFTAYSQRIHSV